MSLESIQEHVMGLLIVAVPFLFVTFLAYREIRVRRARQALTAALDQELAFLRQKLLLVPTGTPGKKIARDLGPVVSEGAAGPGYKHVAEKRALVVLMKRAEAMGADAVVDLHREGTALGPVRLAGRAVILEN